jgi:phenylpyruvate tautomerase PptA (4-oxalocrotonate tautomerase family)
MERIYRIVVVFLAGLVLVCGPLSAIAGEGYRDPLVRISMAPSDLDVPGMLTRLSRDLSVASGVPESGITVIFNEVPANYMITGGKLAETFNDRDHPVVVELHLAGFFSQEQVETCMAAIADSLATHDQISRKNVFILTSQEGSGMVYVFGEALRWQDGQNPFEEEETFK